jgi:hypothetical protein
MVYGCLPRAIQEGCTTAGHCLPCGELAFRRARTHGAGVCPLAGQERRRVVDCRDDHREAMIVRATNLTSLAARRTHRGRSSADLGAARGLSCGSRLPKGSGDDSGSILADGRAFSKLAPHLPTETRGNARVDDRQVISGIIHVLKSGVAGLTRRRTMGRRKPFTIVMFARRQKVSGSICSTRSRKRAARPRRFLSIHQR